jgi:L-alanine-DL-glutamate epimerase-like enolase superfamily enzyme
MNQGEIALPQKIGLDIEVDDAVIEKYRAS